MGRKPIGKRAMTASERQARRRVKKHAQYEMLRTTLMEITTVRSAAKARAIAAEALAYPAEPITCSSEPIE